MVRRYSPRSKAGPSRPFNLRRSGIVAAESTTDCKDKSRKPKNSTLICPSFHKILTSLIHSNITADSEPTNVGKPRGPYRNVSDRYEYLITDPFVKCFNKHFIWCLVCEGKKLSQDSRHSPANFSNWNRHLNTQACIRNQKRFITEALKKVPKTSYSQLGAGDWERLHVLAILSYRFVTR